MKTNVFHVHALSPLHVGIGQAVGVVDLPIARSRATNFPIIPGSAIKGALRNEFRETQTQKELFGPCEISDNQSAQAGALAFGDAHLLLFPVRSLNGVMAMITCPFVLKRYQQDLNRSGKTDLPEVPDAVGEQALIGAGNANVLSGKVLLEDLDLDAHENNQVTAWAKWIAKNVHGSHPAFQNEVERHTVLVSDEAFSFLVDTATEVRARIRINDDTKTVKSGALWYEENLPAESVLWGIVGIGKSRNPSGQENRDEAAMETAWNGVAKQIASMQIGGKATVGRGLIRFLA